MNNKQVKDIRKQVLRHIISTRSAAIRAELTGDQKRSYTDLNEHVESFFSAINSSRVTATELEIYSEDANQLGNKQAAIHLQGAAKSFRDMITHIQSARAALK